MKTRTSWRGTRLAIAVLVAVMLAIPQASLAFSPDASTYEAIDSYVEEQMDASRIPGAALSVVNESKVVHNEGYGHTSGEGDQVTPDTLFGIGSTGKSITALAVMQLVEDGLVDLDSSVQTYIPWFTLEDSQQSANLTVRHLLNMTSGISPIAGGEAFRSTESMSSEEAIRSLADAEFAHEPGSTFAYVNANYVILGHLIEVVTGQSFGEYTKANIFEPLEMNNTFTDIELARQAGYEDGHRYWFGQPVPHDTGDLPSLVPAGYIISTASDLSNYLTMYLNDGTFNGRTILSAAGIDELHQGVAEAALGPWADGATARYAMGWYVGGPWSDGSIVFHPGSEPTFTAMLTLDRENDLGAVMLMNSATEMPLPGAAGALRVPPAGVMSMLVGEDPVSSTDLGRFYTIFSVAVLVVIGFQVLALTKLVRRQVAPETPMLSLRGMLRTLPLVWEFGFGLAIVLSPMLIGMSWRSLWLWTPDMALVLSIIGTISIATGVVRTVKLVRAVRGHSPESPAQGLAPMPTSTPSPISPARNAH